jgi:hypothetical protein
MAIVMNFSLALSAAELTDTEHRSAVATPKLTRADLFMAFL